MIEAYTDGACRGGNPGFCSCAWILYNGNTPGRYNGYYLGPERHTNNYAEYMGLITLLEVLCHNHIRNVIIHCDSLLVVNQVNDVWDVNEQALIPLWVKAYGLLIHGCHVLKHVKGHDGNPGNEAVDRLCNDVLDQHKEDYETVAKD
jgi:ribonuclease HI